MEWSCSSPYHLPSFYLWVSPVETGSWSILLQLWTHPLKILLCFMLHFYRVWLHSIFCSSGRTSDGLEEQPSLLLLNYQLACKLISQLLALTLNTGISKPHWICMIDKPALKHFLAEPTKWATPTNTVIRLQVFVNDIMNGVAGQPDQASKAQKFTWVIFKASFPHPKW